MKTQLQKVASAPKKVAQHVYARRGRYGVAVGLITGAVITRNLDDNTRAEALAFIEQKGLSSEFFLPEDSFQS